MYGIRASSLAFGLAAAALAFSSAALADEKSPAKRTEAARPAPTAAAADDADEDTPGAAAHHDPDNLTAISQFMETVSRGETLYMSRDFAGAKNAFRKAIQLNPKHPLAPFLLGETELALGNLDEAEAVFRQAELVGDKRHAEIQAYILFAIADVLERQKKWPAAKAGWQAYLEWAGKFPDASPFRASATSRIQAIDAFAKLEKSYEIVRKRIAETAHGGVFTEVAPEPKSPSK